MNIHITLTGKTEEILLNLIKKGYAADRSEAIRLALLHYDEHFAITQANATVERAGWMALSERSFGKVWDNEKDDATWSKY